LRFQPDGAAEPLVIFRNPLLPQALYAELALVPLPEKKGDAETLGAVVEVVALDTAWARAPTLGQALGMAELATASTEAAELLVGTLLLAKLDAAGAAAVEGDAVTVRVACTVSVTVTSAPHPPEPAASASPTGAEPPDPPVAAPVAVAGTTVMVSVVVEEIVVVVVGSELATWALTPATPDAAGVGAQIVWVSKKVLVITTVVVIMVVDDPAPMVYT